MSLVPWSHMKPDISDAEIEAFIVDMMKDMRKGDKIKNMLFARHETAGSFVARTLLREYPPCTPQPDMLACQLDLLSSAVTTAFRDRHVNSSSSLDLSSGCLTAFLSSDKSVNSQYPIPTIPLFDPSQGGKTPILNSKAFVSITESNLLDKSRLGLFGKDKDGKMWLVWISRNSVFKHSERVEVDSSTRLVLSLGKVHEGVEFHPLGNKDLVSQVLVERFIQRLDYSNQMILECLLPLLQFLEELKPFGSEEQHFEGKPATYPGKFTLEHEIAYKALTLLNLVGGLRALNTMVMIKQSPSSLGYINPLETELDLIDARTGVLKWEAKKLMNDTSNKVRDPTIASKHDSSLEHLRKVVLFHLQTLYKNPQQSFLIGPYTIAMQSGQTRKH